MMGASQVCGNLFGGALAVVNPRIPFLLGAAAGILQAAIISLGLQETGPSARATDQLLQPVFDPKVTAATKTVTVNNTSGVQLVDLPLRPDHKVTSANRAEQRKQASSGRAWHTIVALFSTRTLSLLTSAALIDGLVDLTWNIRPIFAQQRLGMGPAQYGAWEAARGLVRLCSGALTSWLLRLLGIRGFNLLAHVASIIQQCCWIMSTTRCHLYLALIPMAIGEQGVRDSVLKSCHTRAGGQMGLGLGDVQAALRTMQSLLSVPMPMFMSWLYARDSSLPWAFCAVLSAASAALFAMLSKGEIVRVARNHGHDPEDPQSDTGHKVCPVATV
jgi:hypothetical protein